MELSPASKIQQDKDCLTLTPICELHNNAPLSAIAESVPISSETTSSDKSQECKKSTRKRKSSKTSDQDSTSSEKGLTPYWNDYCAAINSKLWLPTVTDLPGSGLTCSSTLLKKTAGQSWFSIQDWEAPKTNSPKTYSLFSTTSLAKCTAEEVIAAKRIRIYPTAVQKKIFRQWFGASRYVYNKTVEYLNQPKELREKHWMRAALKILPALEEWAAGIPYQVKKIAIRDAYQALINGCKKHRKTGETFELKFRSRKNPRQSCFIPSSAFGEKFPSIYPKITGELHMAEKLQDNPRDSRLLYEHGRWYVVIPYRKAITFTENQGRVVALDPGIRTFLTGFSEDMVFKLGDGDFSRIARICIWMDKLISKMSKVSSRHKRKMKQALSRMRWKVWNLIDELHFKSIRLLLNRFDVLLLPTFETAQMSSRTERKLRAKSVRSMLTFAHFRFKQRLKAAAIAVGKIVLDVSEAYTSKTASWTGELKNIGGAKRICSNGITVDRDINGARGIFLRALGDTPSLRNECAIVSN